MTIMYEYVQEHYITRMIVIVIKLLEFIIDCNKSNRVYVV